MSDRDDKPGRAGAGPTSGGVPDDPERAPDAPPTEEELTASRRLRDALEAWSAPTATAIPPSTGDGDLELVRSLRAAWSPAPLDPDTNAKLAERAARKVPAESADIGGRSAPTMRLVDDLAPAADELASAAALRDALGGHGGGEDARRGDLAPLVELAAALRVAHAPPALDDAAHRAIVERALATIPERGGGDVVVLARRAPMRRAPVLAVASTVLALAASVVLWIANAGGPPGREAPLARVRSTQPLFDAPFGSVDPSARIDRIALARGGDFRDNRFASWGLR